VARRISFTLGRDAGTLTFRRGAGAFTMPMKAMTDDEFDAMDGTSQQHSELPTNAVRRTTLAEFLKRQDEKR
jgi:hypothetical protein